MDELAMTDMEMAQVARACAWVRATAGFLPYLRPFLAARLARHNHRLAQKAAAMTVQETFFLWERLKDEQTAPDRFLNPPQAQAVRNLWEQSQR